MKLYQQVNTFSQKFRKEIPRAISTIGGSTQKVDSFGDDVKKPACPARESGDEWQNGFFFRRSPVREHGVLHSLSEGPYSSF